MKHERLNSLGKFTGFCTSLEAISPLTGKITTFAGPIIPGKTIEDARLFCLENEFGYLHVIGPVHKVGNVSFNFSWHDIKAMAMILFLLISIQGLSQTDQYFSDETLVSRPFTFQQLTDKVGMFDSMHIARVPGDYFHYFHVSEIDYIYTPVDSNLFEREPNIYDGDTPTMKVFQGFGNTTTERFRMFGIQAPEIRYLKTRKEGTASRDHLSKLLESYLVLLVYTFPDNVNYDFDKGKYGRYLNIIYGLDENGYLISINDRMVEDGFAVYKSY